MTTYPIVALRYDTIRLDGSKIRRDARGFARVEAIIAKPGVYTYHEPGGRTVREYLPPEEVARADSLTSVADAPVTNRHPSGMVTPETVAAVEIGHASGPAQATPEGALATLVVKRADALGELGRSLVEVSRGVQVRIDETPGVTPSGERYDRVQRDIVYNHIALGPSGWGRQGASVSLRLDSNGDESFPAAEQPMKYTDPKTKIVHEFKTDSELQAFLDARADSFPPKGEEDEEDPKSKKAEKKDDSAEKARADALQAKLDAREAADRKAAREALEASARKVLGAEVKFDAQGADGKPVPLTDRALRELVIAKLDPSASMVGRADSYVEAYYDVALSSAKPAPVVGRSDADAFAAALAGVKVDGTTRSDSKPTATPDVKMRQDAAEAWKSNKGAAFSLNK